MILHIDDEEHAGLRDALAEALDLLDEMLKLVLWSEKQRSLRNAIVERAEELREMTT